MGNTGSALLGIAMIIGIAVAYWLPSLVAWRSKAPHTSSVVVVNLFLGWTIIGWVVALAMAMRDPAPAPPPGQR